MINLRGIGIWGVGVSGIGFGKRGILGEGIIMMYRLALVTFIVFIVLGVSSVFYAHYIDVRDAEAVVMTRNVVDCVAPEGVVNLSLFDEDVGILSYCGFDDGEIERFYVRVNVSDEGGDVVEFSQGDSGAMWVKDIFENVEMISEGIEKYESGYSDRVYDVVVLSSKDDSGEPEGEIESYGKVEVEVLVSHE